MMLKGLLLVTLGYHARLMVECSGEWSYEGETGPSSWPDHFPLCGGKKQSPISIKEKQTKFDPSLKPFKYKNFEKVPQGTNFNMVNNGHSLQIDIETINPEIYKVSQGGLPGTYTPLQFHFHWAGIGNEKGSEHVIDNSKYPMELHIVHRNIKYSTVPEALKHSDGLAVLGVFFEIDDDDNPLLEMLIKNFDAVKYKDATLAIPPFPIEKLLPSEDPEDYFRYGGSLTTPECNEAVVWTLFKKPLEISTKQLNKFRNLLQGKKGTEEVISNNWRPVQPLNGRAVSRSFKDDDDRK